MKSAAFRHILREQHLEHHLVIRGAGGGVSLLGAEVGKFGVDGACSCRTIISMIRLVLLMIVSVLSNPALHTLELWRLCLCWLKLWWCANRGLPMEGIICIGIWKPGVWVDRMMVVWSAEMMCMKCEKRSRNTQSDTHTRSKQEKVSETSNQKPSQT